MDGLKKFLRKPNTTITAVRLDLETEGFTYEKWGGTQRCKRGDWLVHIAGGTYTIDGESFARMYRKVSDGVYEKVVPVWAEREETAGVIETMEGSTAYEAGDMLVYSGADRTDGYAMSIETFESVYQPA